MAKQRARRQRLL